MKIIKKKITVFKQTGEELEKEIREKTVGYIVAGFSVVAGLAWNEAIKAFIEEFFPLHRDTVKAKFVYAALITMLVVVISLYLTRLFKTVKKEEKVEEKVEEKIENNKTK